MRPVLAGAGAVLVASACSFLVNFDPEGQRCGTGAACLPEYVCVDGLCVRDTGTDAGTDAGYAFFEAWLSRTQVPSDQVVSPTTGAAQGSGSLEYSYGTNTLRWSVHHDAGQVSAAVHIGHPGVSGSVWLDAGYAPTPMTGSTTITEDAEAWLIEQLTRGHLYIALYDQSGYEIIRGYIVERGGRIFVAPIYDSSLVPTLVARAGFVVSADAGTLYHDVTIDGQRDIGAFAAEIYDYSAVAPPPPLVDRLWSPLPFDPSRSSGATTLPGGVLMLLEEPDRTYFKLHTQTYGDLSGNISQLK